ncbi:putative CAMK family protein kinase [Tritrichomonas foetus]|uniref:CAMK family protein kinase n=1 Tax=Tritrichomonas foetus TaxID=1144522 RepID=A0A1J4JL42_9EUKA|nr:putative CAMK family protein kinase [Tritrichomonas foetus]|eukprot:OHS99814.1 putative CAMK family protein kinase [Tritrichomonas foetus]
MAKVKAGRYQMPPFLPEIQDLISRMLTVNIEERIKLDQIKEHPAFHLFLPKNYSIPNPIPLPFLPEPIDVSTIDEKLFTVLVHLGFLDESEIKDELESKTHNMAKVFCHILTTGFSLESLPWDDELQNQVASIPNDEFLVDGQDGQRAFTLHANDPFYKRQAPMSMGSPDIFSLVEKTQWVDNQVDIDVEYEGKTEIPDITVPLPQLFAGIQQQLSLQMYKYFYPNDMTLFTKYPEDNMYIVVQAQYTSRETISLTLRHMHGSVLLFSTFVQMINDIISSFG